SDEIFAMLSEFTSKHPLEIHSTSTGLTEGIDLGSNNFDAIKPISVAILVGNGIRSYDAGEIWHLFDQRYNIKLTKLEATRVSSVDLSRYTDIIIPSLGYGPNPLSESAGTKLKQWVRAGGTLIGYRNALNWMNSNDLLSFNTRQAKVRAAKNLSFDQARDYYGAQVTGGAIFEANIDRSHPINFGYTNDKIALFRNTNQFIEPRPNSFENPITYTQSPLLSGYISEENLEALKGSSAFSIKSIGRGKVIGFTDNTNFRAFWYGTNRLLMNAIFFGDSM
ncbi:MAG: zinc carboxypeptidase, partial [Flavobacteriaceae bacterium]